jgi:mRNA interferase MazF
MVKKYVPERGDIVWLDFSPTRGHEQTSVRPALVLSHKPYNQKVGLSIVCAITSQPKNYPFEVVFEGKSVTGVVLSDQIRSVAWKERKARFVEKAPLHVLEEVLAKIQTLLE